MGNISFTGLSSGLDTDSMVQAMLINYQSKIDKAQQKQAKLEYKQEAWNNMNKKLNDFFKIADKMRTAGNYTGTKATSSSSAVTVHSKGTTTKGTHSVEVTQLAKSANLNGKIQGSNLTKNTKLEELGITSETTIKLNGKEIKLTPSSTLSTLESDLKAADSKLTVNIDADNGYIFISTQSTGEDAEIKLEGDQDVFKKLGLIDSANTTIDPSTNKATITVNGQNAKYTYNGAALESQTNDVTINGISMTFNEETSSAAKIEITTDTEPIVTMVKEFVDKYNELIKEMDDMYNAVDTGLDPLTEAEKEDMTASEIEKYEEKLKAVALRRDPTLKSIRDSLRNALQISLPDNTDYDDLSSIGVTTGTWSEKGKLHLDEDKLKEALEKNSTEVLSIFTKSSKKDEAGKITTKGGAMTSLYDTFTSLRKRIDSVKSYESYYNDYIVKDNIKSAKEAVTKAKDKYEAMKKIYQAKFTAMETALSSLNSQGSTISSWLAQ
ncbi:MAG: flagellar filament capping protein FliD [Cellulosilyticum sp.]|nr:flagellar filament capping protein FliD [Cellulosilyticum sp.]